VVEEAEIDLVIQCKDSRDFYDRYLKAFPDTKKVSTVSQRSGSAGANLQRNGRCLFLQQKQEQNPRMRLLH
jgi:hypothetical protein